MKCESFKWYLDNIYPDLHVPEDRPGYYGALHNKGWNSHCLDYAPLPHSPTGGKVAMYGCHGQGGNQFFELTSKGEIRFNSVKEMCISVVKSDNTITMRECVEDHRTVPDSQIWVQDKELFKSPSINKCIEGEVNGGKAIVIMRDCDPTREYQKWFWIA